MTFKMFNLYVEDGQGLVEYGLLIFLIVIVAVSALVLFQGGLGDFFAALAGSLGNAVNIIQGN